MTMLTVAWAWARAVTQTGQVCPRPDRMDLRILHSQVARNFNPAHLVISNPQQTYSCVPISSMEISGSLGNLLCIKEERDKPKTLTIWKIKRGVEGGKGGVNGDRRRLDLGQWAHSTPYRWCVTGLYTWNPNNFISQCHPNKFSEKAINNNNLWN